MKMLLRLSREAIRYKALYVIAISVPVCLGILLRREDARG